MPRLDFHGETGCNRRPVEAALREQHDDSSRRGADPSETAPVVVKWRALYHWLDEYYSSYWVIAALPTIVLIICLVRTLRAADGTGPLAPRRVDWRFGLLMLAFLLGWRWTPLFEIKDLNPDESGMLAGAITLRHDPVFWRSVDGITSGPLNYYALLPLNLLGVPLNYFGARLTALLMVWGALSATCAMLRSTYGTRIARVAILPALVFFAAATDVDFVHYSSEHPSLLFAGVGVWLLWICRPRPGDAPGTVRWPWLLGGAVVGLMPWAKLQSSPPALALALWGAWLAFSNFGQPLGARIVQIAKLAAATLAPSLVFLLAVAAAGLFPHFYRSYLLDNLTFVDRGLDYGAVAGQLQFVAQSSWHYPIFLLGVVVVVVVAAVERLVRRKPPGPIVGASLAFTLVAFCVTLTPGRAFYHYLLYTVLPLATWAGAAYADLAVALTRRRAQIALAVVFIAVTAAPMLIVRVVHVRVPLIYGDFEEYWLHPYDAVGKVLVRYRRDGDTLGLWGWYSHAYVQANLPQAQREAESEHQLRQWPMRDTWFRPKYMEDLRRNRPALFVDAVGPGAFCFTEREKHAHETFRPLRRYIRENYTLAADEGHARVYVRNDRYAEKGPAVPR